MDCAAVAVEFEFVRLLTAVARWQCPRQAGSGDADAEAVREVFEGHRGGLRGVQVEPFVTSAGVVGRREAPRVSP
jgi:hypothetical protein